MSLYRLKPTKLDDEAWKRSSYTGDCHVNAQTELEARNAAALQFGTMGRASPGSEITGSPWHQFDLVDCAEIAAIGPLPPEGVVMVPTGSEWRPAQEKA